MPNVRVHKPNGMLFLDFRFKGVRCREYTALSDSPANRKKLEKLLDRITAEIKAGTFEYAAYFPGSKALARLNESQHGEVTRELGKTTEAVPPSVDSGTTEFSDQVASTPPFSTFADQWITDHSVEWRRSHTRSVVSTVQGRLVNYFKSRVVGSITKSDVLAFRAHLAKEPGRGNKTGLSAKRINEIMGTLSQILADAADRFEFTSPMVNVKRLRLKRVDVQPFSLAQVQTLIATARPDFRNYFTVRFFTGMRTGEVHGLKWKYVDFERRQILVRETFVLGEDEYTKTDGSQRDIHMSQPVWDALMAQHQVTGRASEYVFCNLLGDPLDNANFTKRVWYPLLRHLGYEPRKPYQMRHTAATLWLASGEAPEWIARQLGHTSTEMLFRVYSRYVPNLTRQDGSAMERLLASQLSQGPLVPMLVHDSPIPLSSASSERANTVRLSPPLPAHANAGAQAVFTYIPAHQAGVVQPMAQPKPRGRVAQRACTRSPLIATMRVPMACKKRNNTGYERC